MNTIPHPSQPASPKAPARRRNINYESKLTANEEAIMRWTSKLKLAATKLTRLSSKRRRLIAAQANQAITKNTTSPFSRKFS